MRRTLRKHWKIYLLRLIEIEGQASVVTVCFLTFLYVLGIFPDGASQSTSFGHEKTVFQCQIDVTNKQIDRLAYELYGLTEDEIRIVEEATK